MRAVETEEVILRSFINQRPDLDSNQDHGLRRAGCDPLHHQDEIFRFAGCLTGLEPVPSGSQPGVQKPLHHKHHKKAGGVASASPRA